MANQNTHFYCYSTNLFHFLKANGQRYNCTGLHTETKRQFWQFNRTPELSALLEEYERNKTAKLR